MGNRVWQIPQDQFVAIWNAAGTLAEAAERVRQVAGGAAPRWAVMARAGELRRQGVGMKPLPAATAPTVARV